MEKKFTVLLENQTVGTVVSDTQVTDGDTVTVSLYDENGTLITETGVVEEILEIDEGDPENTPWYAREEPESYFPAPGM
jgi:hypothetical protein